MLGGVSRLGKIPCRDQRRVLFVPELLFVLELDRSMLIAFSFEPYVETDWREGALGRCSGVPNWKLDSCGLAGGSVSTFSATDLERLVRRDELSMLVRIE